MKLFLMRHAAAEDAKEKSDISRFLTLIGKDEAAKAASFLEKYHIDKILVSSAMRTKQTAEIIQSKIKCDKCEILPELYGSAPKKIIEIIARQNSADKTLLAIAHNPGIFKASLALMDSDSERYDELLAHGMKTAKIVELDFPAVTSWDELRLPST